MDFDRKLGQALDSETSVKPLDEYTPELQVLAFYPTRIQTVSADLMKGLSEEELEEYTNTPGPGGRWHKVIQKQANNFPVGTPYATSPEQLRSMIDDGFPEPSEEDWDWVS